MWLPRASSTINIMGICTMISTLIQIREFNFKKIEKTDLRLRSVFFYLENDFLQ